VTFCSFPVPVSTLSLQTVLMAEARMTRDKTHLKTFHATMAVTRLEEWCVEAATAEQAKALLAAGQGYRCQLGDCVHIELQAFEDVAAHPSPHNK
jgi:hypothetical protein